MKKVNLEDLRKGDWIVVYWLDASDEKARLEWHEANPELHVKDWGVYLGVAGRKHRFLLVGKDVTEVNNDWGATRIPLDMVYEIILVMPREQVALFIEEVKTIGRRVRLRKHARRNYSRVTVV